MGSSLLNGRPAFGRLATLFHWLSNFSALSTAHTSRWHPPHDRCRSPQHHCAQPSEFQSPLPTHESCLLLTECPLGWYHLHGCVGDGKHELSAHLDGTISDCPPHRGHANSSGRQGFRHPGGGHCPPGRARSWNRARLRSTKSSLHQTYRIQIFSTKADLIPLVSPTRLRSSVGLP